MRQVVLRLLEKDPDRRYQDAETVVGDLQGIVEGHGLGLVPRPTPRSAPVRYAVAAAVAVALVVVSLLAWNRWRPATTESPPPRTLIAVLPFLDQTLDDPGGLRGEMIAALLAADLAESRVVRSVGNDRINEILENLPRGSSRVEQLEKVGEAVAAEWVLAGSLFRDGDAYQAAVDVYKAGMPDPFGSFRVGAARTAGLVDLASVELRRLLFPDSSPNEESDPRAADISSESEEARELALRARLAAREYRLAEARDLLERALAIDPEFILAHSALANVLDAAGYSTEARRRAERAVRLVEGRPAPPTRRIELEVEAVHARLFDDFDREVQVREELARLFPDEPATLNGAASALVQDAEFDRALGYVERSLGLDEKSPGTYRLQAHVFRGLGRSDAESDALDQAERLYRAMDSKSGLALIVDERGLAAWARGDLDAAVSHFLDAAERFEEAGLEVEAARSLSNAGDCSLVRGDHARARELYDQTMVVFRQAGAFRHIADNLDKLGANLYVRGQLQEAEVILRDAVEQAEEIGNPKLVLSALSNLSGLVIYRGRLVEGRWMAERALKLAQERGDRLREVANRTMLADVHFQQGELDRAGRAYGDLIDLEESPGGSTEGLAWALTGLAEIQELQGDLEEASLTMERAVELADETGRRVVRGYTRLRRALVAGELARWDDAGTDLRVAEELGNEEGQPLEDLLHRVALSRGTIALLRGEWSVAEPLMETAREAGAKTGANGVEGPALVGAAEVALQLGEPDRAVRLARRAISMPRGRVLDQTMARVELASALAKKGDGGEAGDVALQALTEAEAMGVPLVAAKAASILVTLPEPTRPLDADRIRDRGLESLRRYLDGVSEERRSAVRSRQDIAEIATALERERDS
jgi:tetratricopeptide (TPR) repeat protein